jgi:O-glycosyl hydrolase
MKTNCLTFFFLTLLLFFPGSGVFAQEATIHIFPEIKRQMIRSIGGNYCQANYSAHAADAIGNETLREFRPSHVRVALPMRLKRTVSEDYRGEKLTRQPLVIEVLEGLKRMKNEFGVKNFTISVWDLPDEFILNPSRRSQRIINPESYDEVIQMLTDFLLKAKHEYGVEVDQFSFNESDGGYPIIFSPEATIVFVKKAGQKLEKAGVKTTFLLADSAQTIGTVEFATRIMGDPAIWKYLGPLSFHSWSSENILDKEFERIAAFGKAWNKEIWCSELGFDAQAWKEKDRFKSWNYGLRVAIISHRVMKYAEAEVTLYWTWQNNYEIMSADLKQKYPSYYVTRHLVDYLNTGTQIVHSISSDPEILPISGIHIDGSKVLNLINLKKVPIRVKVTGFDSQEIDGFTTTETNNWETRKKAANTQDGKVVFQLKPESINTYLFKN